MEALFLKLENENVFQIIMQTEAVTLFSWCFVLFVCFFPNILGNWKDSAQNLKISRIVFHVNKYWMSEELVLETSITLAVNLALDKD